MLLLATAPLAACAQWDANAWPAYEHPRSGKAHATDCYSSLWERTSSWGGGWTPAAPVWYRSQRANLIAMKISLKAALAEYCYPTTPSGLLTAMNAETNVPSVVYALPDMTVTGFVAWAKIPTNFFDYTPYRCLDGSGPFTNDTTVGHAHGWPATDAGTNFPAGRTNWYTSDYGWDTFRHCVTQLFLLSASGIASNTVTSVGGESTSYTDDWPTIEDEAEGSFADRSASWNWGSDKWNLGGTPEQYWARLNTRMDELYQTHSMIVTQFAPVISAMVITRTRSSTFVVGALFSYDGAQLSYTNRGAWWSADYLATNIAMPYGWQSVSGTYAGRMGKAVVGSTNTIPIWCANPGAYPNNVTASGLSWGFASAGSGYLFLFDYSGPDGFKYK